MFYTARITFSLNEVTAIEVLSGKKSQVLRAEGQKHHCKQMLTSGVSSDCIKTTHLLLPLYFNVTSTVLLVSCC